MPAKPKDSGMYVCVQTHTVGDEMIYQGALYRGSHWAVKANPDYFDLAENRVTPDVEQATAAPGEKRGDA